MNLDYGAEEVAYRHEIRAWLAENVPTIKREMAAHRTKTFLALQRTWQAKLYDAGLVGMAWPVEYGGQNASVIRQVIAGEEMVAADAPPAINGIGLSILGPTLIAFGTDEQKARFLPKILTAEEIWCQGFSEPDAGSDLASLRTSAVAKGDDFVLNGQKLWSSASSIAEWGFFLARTDARAPKREGITFFLVKMDSPGVEVRPLRTITGHQHFGEIFLSDVVVPRANVVGELNDGWRVAKATLAFERSGLSGVAGIERNLLAIWALASDLQGSQDATEWQREVRQDLAQSWIELQGLRYFGYRMLTYQSAKRDVAPYAPVGKIFASSIRQRLMQAALRMQGPLARLGKRSPGAVENGRWQQMYLDSRAYSIGGGTSEIMRNIIAERLLRLPKSSED